jgi:hypothetical protein
MASLVRVGAGCNARPDPLSSLPYQPSNQEPPVSNASP